MPLQPTRTTCFVCNSPQLQPFIWLKREGTPHGQSGHAYVYSSITFVTCAPCGHGQMEHYSHDCWSHYEDEDWDMYWWYVLEPDAVAQLRGLLIACPSPLEPDCGCSLHQALRATCQTLYSRIKHAVSAAGPVSFATLSLSVKDGLPGFSVKKG